MCVIYVLVTASLWSPSTYTHQQDFTQDHLVLRKQSYTRTLSPGSGPTAQDIDSPDSGLVLMPVPQRSEKSLLSSAE